MDLLQIAPNVVINLANLEAVVKVQMIRQDEQGRSLPPEPVYQLRMVSGRQFNITDSTVISAIDSSISTGGTDDPMTTERPETLAQKILRFFRR